MSEADKLFEELGYEKDHIICEVGYSKHDVFIEFDLKDKKVAVFNWQDYYQGYEFFGIEELKAINMKIKELGWE